MGGERDDTCDHGLSRSWKVDVCEEEKKRKKKVSDLTGTWRQTMEKKMPLKNTTINNNSMTDTVYRGL